MKRNAANVSVTPEEWDAHRPIISRLYIEQDKTLSDVVAIMQRKYRFLATRRMYKTRLAQWGLRKYITARDVPELTQHVRAKTTRNHKAIPVRGRELSMARVDRYIKRNTTRFLVNHSTTAPRTGKPLAPAPRLLSLPTDLRFQDEIIHLSCQFVSASYEGGRWCPDSTDPVFFASRVTNTWLNETTCGVLLIEEGHYRRAFESLNNSFDQLKGLLCDPDPSLFIYLYYVTLQLPEHISRQMRAYAAEMSAITLPSNHPMNLLWLRLSQLENQQLLDQAWNILFPYFQVLKERFRYCEYGILKFSATFYRIMAQLGCLDLESAKSKLLDIIRDLEVMGKHPIQVVHTKLAVVKILLRAEEYGEAAIVLGEVAQRVHQYGGSPGVRHIYHSLGFDLQKAIGTTQHAVDAGRNYMRFCLNEHGPADPKTLDAISGVKSYFTEIGRVEEGNRLQQILESEEGLETYFDEIGMTDQEHGNNEQSALKCYP